MFGAIVFWGFIGLFLYQTYRWLTASQRPQIQWKVVEARVTEAVPQSRRGEWLLRLTYVVNGVSYPVEGLTYESNNQPPTTIKLVYQEQNPTIWEWEEDHSLDQDDHGDIKAAWFWIAITGALIGGIVVYVVYFLK